MALKDGHPLKEGTPQPRHAGPGDMTDLELLPRRFEVFSADMIGRVETLQNTLADRILPLLTVIQQQVTDQGSRLNKLESHSHAMDRRLAALEAARPKRKPRKRKARS